jgi:hypothetical protein
MAKLPIEPPEMFDIQHDDHRDGASGASEQKFRDVTRPKGE